MKRFDKTRYSMAQLDGVPFDVLRFNLAQNSYRNNRTWCFVCSTESAAQNNTAKSSSPSGCSALHDPTWHAPLPPSRALPLETTRPALPRAYPYPRACERTRSWPREAASVGRASQGSQRTGPTRLHSVPARRPQMDARPLHAHHTCGMHCVGLAVLSMACILLRCRVIHSKM